MGGKEPPLQRGPAWQQPSWPSVIAILDERDAVVDVLRAAQGSVVVGQLLPDLGRALDRLALTRRT